MRQLLAILLMLSALCFAADPATSILRGKLGQNGGKPVLELKDHKLIPLDGDEATRGVLTDKRLAGAALEATGHFDKADVFVVDPIHTKALHVYHGATRHTISYWCDVCSIRTYTP